jgi:copper resistance protein C
MLRTIRRALVPVLIATVAVTALTAAYHASLTKALPAVDGTVVVAPTELTLWFSERPDLPLSNIRLLGPDSASIPVTAPRATTDTLSIATTVRGTLTPGKYTVRYRTAGPDGHVMSGKYSFTYQP